MNYLSIKSLLFRSYRTLRGFLSEGEILQIFDDGMKHLHTHYTLDSKSQELTVHENIAKLPCGLVVLGPVLHNSTRLTYCSDSIDYRVLKPAVGTYMGGKPAITNLDMVFFDEIAKDHEFMQAMHNPVSSGVLCYKLQADYLHTPMRNGKLMLHFLSVPMDADDFPMIPDHPDYKEALFWYSIKRAMEAGWAGNRNLMLNGAEGADQKWERHARRAINSITYPSPDQMWSMMDNQQALIYPTGWSADLMMNRQGTHFLD